VPRAALIVNPFSTAVTPQRVAEVEAVLRRHLELETHATSAPGDATSLAAEAADSGADAVILFSGDGTYNEAINGAAGRVPFGFLPGGGASVLSRALGLSRNHVEAATQVATAIVANRTRSIGLGRVNGRRFSFAAGIGLDAEAVRRVEARGRKPDGRRANNFAFVQAVFSQLAETRFRLEPQLEIVGQGRAAFVLVAVGRPYTYAGRLAVTFGGKDSLHGGLDFVGPKVVSPRTAPRLLGRGLRGTLEPDETLLAGHDVDGFEVRCDRPLPLEVDGEDLGDVTGAIFEAERDALRVLV
jgi:diacylglycerol kinase family enzyme